MTVRPASGGGADPELGAMAPGASDAPPAGGPSGPQVEVVCGIDGPLDRAVALATRLGVPLHCPGGPDARSGAEPVGASSALQGARDAARSQRPPFEPEPGRLYLKVTAGGLSLLRDGMELLPDFAEMAPRIRQGALQRELLVKAARVKGIDAPRALDATAGLGEDSLLLAAAGFTVTLCEADPVIAALLADALERASRDAALAPIVGRMRLVEEDSRTVLARLGADPDARPDVVYLDPMFPGRVKSAAVKKKFQLIHGLERPCDPLDEGSLLQAALSAHPRKVVIKRPVKGPYLAGVKPSHSVAGKAVRYDCIVPPR